MNAHVRMLAVLMAGAGAAPALAGTPAYRIVDLTELAEPLGVVQSEARAINEAGQITGFEVLPEFRARAIAWGRDGTPTILPLLLETDNSSVTTGITEDGAPLGASDEVTVTKQGDLIIITQDEKATMWTSGGPVAIADLVTGGDTFIDLHFAQAANSLGQIVGRGDDPSVPPFFGNGWLFDDGIVTDLGALTRPLAINERGQIVGHSSFFQDHAHLWDRGVLTDLHDHPAIGGVTSRAWDVNDDSIVVGEAQFHISKPEEPAVWIGGVPSRLVPDVNRPQGIATGVNAAGDIVGFYADLDDLSGPFIGVMWREGVRVELLDLVDPAEGWEVLYAFDVNDRGQIVGGGFRNGQWGRAFVMTPRCAEDVDGDGAIGFADLLAILAAWGPCPGCAEDVTGDGTVGFADLLAALAAWGECG
jgi:uncharacterized membrane protein